MSAKRHTDPHKIRELRFVAAFWVLKVNVDSIELDVLDVLDGLAEEAVDVGLGGEHGPPGCGAGVAAADRQHQLECRLL